MIKKIASKLAKKTTAKKAAKTTAAKTKAVATKKKTVTKKRTSKKMTQEELFALIEKTAYELYEGRGYSHGSDAGDWYEAEKIVLAPAKK